MGLQDQLMADLKTAMRDGDVTRREAIRMLRAAILNEEVELQKQAFDARRAESAAGSTDDVAAPRRALTEEEMLGVVGRLVKRHQDSIAEFKKGGRADLVAHEQAQLAIISSYLPYQLLTHDEVEARVQALIAETGASGRGDIGKLMPRLSAELRGKADMNEVRGVVQELLGA